MWEENQSRGSFFDESLLSIWALKFIPLTSHSSYISALSFPSIRRSNSLQLEFTFPARLTKDIFRKLNLGHFYLHHINLSGLIHKGCKNRAQHRIYSGSHWSKFFTSIHTHKLPITSHNYINNKPQIFILTASSSSHGSDRSIPSFFLLHLNHDVQPASNCFFCGSFAWSLSSPKAEKKILSWWIKSVPKRGRQKFPWLFNDFA